MITWTWTPLMKLATWSIKGELSHRRACRDRESGLSDGRTIAYWPEG
jgi:hypothetical protein